MLRGIRDSSFYVLGIALGALILGCGEGPSATTAPRTALEPSARPGPGPTNSEINFEKRYMSDAIDAAELTRRMAEVCMAKQGLNPALSSFCSETAGDAAQHVSTLQSWLEDWYGIQYSPVLGGADERQLGNLAALEGADFEAAYLEDMIKHYTTSVRKEQQCYGRANTTALILFCFNAQFEHNEDIAQMEQWLCDWYGDCPR